ncbi:hypothetical protein BGZ72_007357 [Mortierella alpina]|nr:hypothetical protein BGZ72_007357 [Mortierella alpina]
MKISYPYSLIALLAILTKSEAGPAAYGICQTGCNGLAVACYGAGGFVFGTVTAGAGIPAAVVACNVGLGACMAGCVLAGLAPTPYAQTVKEYDTGQKRTSKPDILVALEVASTAPDTESFGARGKGNSGSGGDGNGDLHSDWKGTSTR